MEKLLTCLRGTKVKRVPEAAGLSFQWLVRELWCQNSTVPLPQAGVLPHGLGRFNWRQAGLFPNRDLGPHDPSEQLSPQGRPLQPPTHSPCTGSVCTRRDFRRQTQKNATMNSTEYTRTHAIKQYLEMCHPVRSCP